MNYQTIEEIYTANDKIREKLLAVIENISDEQANVLREGERWTVAQIVEHIGIVQESMSKISAKLLNAAKENGKASEGKVLIGEDFTQKAAGAREQKFQAPESMNPTGSRTLSESIEKMAETRQKLRDLQPLFETLDCSEHKFPHPAFGDLTAHEWLALVGGHESRHIAQIKKMLA